MLSARLTLAFRSGLAVLPARGRIAVIAPQVGDDLAMLPKDRTQVVTRHYPVHRAFAEAGYDTAVAPSGTYALSILCLPRAKAEARAMIALASEITDGPVIVDGQKTDGVDSILKEIRKRGNVGEVISKAHGKIFAVTGGSFDDWRVRPHRFPREDRTGAFVTAPGAFSADAIDPGSQALAKALPVSLKGTVVDLGAGWGYLSDAILSRDGVTRVDLVEADHAALDAARENVTDPRARFHWADARDFRPDGFVDHVVTNPPFHTGRATDPELGLAFIRAAAAMLKPHGTLWLVANRHLPYEKTLEATFRDVQTLDQSAQYKLYSASRPRSPRKG